ncbi:ATP/GTP-binding protein [Streptomyces diastaticus]|uniref:PKD domain-containing protein n=1 Tax=Streptomyces tremellae TaxID=1124239 RepID=A0ABP7FUU7_9ACTN
MFESSRVSVVWRADGADDVVTIDPEILARQAVDSMTLRPPKVASPRSEGTYVVGMPMWLWVERGQSRMGPVSASASAGSVTVTATARVERLVWDMSDGITVTCHGPGPRYAADHGKAMYPDCGHRYERPGEHQVTVTVHWDRGVDGDGRRRRHPRGDPHDRAGEELREAQVLDTPDPTPSCRLGRRPCQ